MIKIALIIKCELILKGLKSMLSTSDDFSVCFTSTELSKWENCKEYDMAIIDEAFGFDAIVAIHLNTPVKNLVIFTEMEDRHKAARARALGFSGCFNASIGKEDLISRLKNVHGGLEFFTKEELRHISGALSQPAKERETPLTQREMQVLQKLTLGLTNKEISRELKISYETVKEHVQKVLRKLGVSDRTQAAVWGVRKGLFT